MTKKKQNKVKLKISAADYIKAVKKADREAQLEQSAGWQRVTKVHKSKKVYDRKKYKKNTSDE